MVATDTARVAAELKLFGLKPRITIILPSILIALVTICMCLRMYVRTFLIKAFGKDDWVLIAACIVFFADSGLYITLGSIQLKEGIFKPYLKARSLAVSTTMLYLVDQVVIKLALAYFFLRIVNQKWQRYLILVSVTFYALYTIAFTLVALFACGVPTPAQFAKGQCISWKTTLGPMNYFGASLNAVVDWILTSIPIIAIRHVQMSRKEKISVSILISLGLVASIVSIARIPFVRGIDPTKGFHFYANALPLYLASTSENAVAIMALSLASLRPLYARMAQVAKTKFSGSGYFGRKQSSGYIFGSAQVSDRRFMSPTPDPQGRIMETKRVEVRHQAIEIRQHADLLRDEVKEVLPPVPLKEKAEEKPKDEWAQMQERSVRGAPFALLTPVKERAYVPAHKHYSRFLGKSWYDHGGA